MVHWTNTTLWLLIGVCVTSISTLTLVPLFCYHLRHTIKIIISNFQDVHSKTTPKNQKTVNDKNKLIFSILILFTITCYTIISISNLSASISEILALKPNCIFYHKFNSIWAIVAKTSLYLLFVYRLKISFKNSAYSYNNKFILFLSFIIIINGIVFIIASIFYTDAERKYLIDYFDNDNDNSNNRTHYWCKYVLPHVFAIPYIIIDSILNILLSILFIKPMITVHKNINNMGNNNNNNNNNRNLERLAIKTSILVVVTCMTSLLILIILAIGNWGAFIAIDCAINSFCLVLMLQHYNKLYKKCCCICIKLHCNVSN